MAAQICGRHGNQEFQISNMAATQTRGLICR